MTPFISTPYSKEQILAQLRDYAGDEDLISYVADMTVTACKEDDWHPLEFLEYLTTAIDEPDMNYPVYDENGILTDLFNHYIDDIDEIVLKHQKETGQTLSIHFGIKEFFARFAIEKIADDLFHEFKSEITENNEP